MPGSWGTHSEPIPGYRLIERLGRGGFGEVWKAEAPGGLVKAIKFVYGSMASDDGDSKHATQELKSLARIKGIRHPFILSMERFDVIDGELMIVMELADRNLEDRLRECQSQGMPGIPRAELLKYLSEAAEALDLMNTEYDLQHLDIKPQNLFLVRSHIKVADFGLVKDLEGFSAQVTGGVTPIYAPPETFDGWVSRFSDQYSLAIVYQEMLTGRRPFPGPSARQLMVQHLTMEPDVSVLPIADQAIVRKALAKDPNDRYASCTEFIDTLLRAKEIPIPSATPVPSWVPVHMESLKDLIDESAATMSTQLSRSGTRASASTTVRAPISFQALVERVSPEGSLVPTLVIGIGATGIRLLERLRTKTSILYGDQPNGPAIRFVGLDVDPHVLREVSENGRISDTSHDQLMPCRLNKPSYYLKEWDNLKYLSSWLDPNYLYQMSVMGTTNGHRPLGRLGFVDNHKRILSRLRMEIGELMSVESIDAAIAATGQKLRTEKPRIYVVAAMGGGTGSGMFVDICYLVRRILLEAGDQNPDVQGLLVAGIHPADRSKDLRKINQYALAQDLLALTQPETEFVADYDIEGGKPRFNGPPVNAAYFFDAMAEHLPEPRMNVVLDAMTEFVSASVSGPLGRQFDEMAVREQWPIFRSMGWFSLHFPTHSLIRQAACKLCRSIVARWMEPLARRDAEEINARALQHAASPTYSAERVSKKLIAACDAQLPESIVALVSKQIAVLDHRLRSTSSAVHQKVYQEAIFDLKQLLGLDPGEETADIEHVPPFDLAMRAAANKVADELFQPLLSAISDSMEHPGSKLEVAKQVWDGLLQYFISKVDTEQEFSVNARNVVCSRVLDLHNKLKSPSSVDSRRAMIELIQQYTLEKIEHRLREQVLQVYLGLRGRLSDRARELMSARQFFELVLERFDSEFEKAAITGTGHATQTLFPGGVTTLSDAVNELYHQLSGEPIHRLEQTLQTAVFAPQGGLWKVCSSARTNDIRLSAAILREASLWIEATLPDVDVAQCFLDRHAEDNSNLGHELRVFYDWSHPSVYGRSAADSSPDPIPMSESLFISTPKTDSGEKIRSSFQQLVPGVSSISVAGGDQVSFCRVFGHPSLGRLLPLWVLKSRRLYDAACQTRLSPRIMTPLVHQT